MIVVNHKQQELASWRPGNTTRLNVGATTGATKLCIAEQWFDPGTGAPTHTHFETEETITILEGRAEFWVGAEHAELEPEMTIILPPFSHHGFRNLSDETLHVWAAYSNAAVRTKYEADPDSTYTIGGADGQRVDATRVRQC